MRQVVAMMDHLTFDSSDVFNEPLKIVLVCEKLSDEFVQVMKANKLQLTQCSWRDPVHP